MTQSIKISQSDLGQSLEPVHTCHKCKDLELVKVEPKETKKPQKRTEFKKPLLKKQLRETRAQVITDLSVIKEEQSEETYMN